MLYFTFLPHATISIAFGKSPAVLALWTLVTSFRTITFCKGTIFSYFISISEKRIYLVSESKNDMLKRGTRPMWDRVILIALNILTQSKIILTQLRRGTILNVRHSDSNKFEHPHTIKTYINIVSRMSSFQPYLY